MIILTILLTFVTGLLLLWISRQHKHINFFEQLGLGFSVALSLFVFELFLEGVFLDKLSLLFPIITFGTLILVFAYRSIKGETYLAEISKSISKTFKNMANSFRELMKWKKALSILVFIYVIFKIFLVFSINMNMPTYDEDAVTGWDLKTKIYTENKSMVLDKTNPEFLGAALDRNVFAPLTDTFFLLPYGKFQVGLSNIISPLFYLVSILLIFGIFLRKTNYLLALLGVYLFCSMPYLFIQGFGSYLNYISGFYIFILLFYFLDSFLFTEINLGMGIQLMIAAFLGVVIRNESIILIFAVLLPIVAIYIYHLKYIKKAKVDMKFIKYLAIPFLVGCAIGFASNKYVLSLYPVGSNLNVGGIKGGIIGDFFKNFNMEIIGMVLSQLFYHSDYSMLYMLLGLSIILVYVYKKFNLFSNFFLLAFAILQAGTIFILTANPALGIATHFGMVRFSLVSVLLALFILIYNLFLLTQRR